MRVAGKDGHGQAMNAIEPALISYMDGAMSHCTEKRWREIREGQ